ncbi:MCE family protein [Mycolicibacterium smegmatis]|uniref:Virulence factor Mce family protein n=3 Tax=Mycolicibacterium smegmatis TaxID=1772 RepID=A0R4F8_MYCS2|nr:MCE family protein [Mycolicibacterium smegmatis]ABK73948.1 virulence factor Mce family protein [Mycolicibacterium smegmatis MC2 155]AFP42096.1 MCE-family protein MCE1a [Mycolicibacterium smegmatis MC2 155]AIU10824.1 MCE-family protein MCE1A [Mycolicibacterium smegmatis MC2 155]AIU17449.1 MCE-family protein MCE1A [Mycolicibacterium smegmatis]AIU24072.1 MCE-family protein MCE1A [Mycolicibacterium smegmatis]
MSVERRKPPYRTAGLAALAIMALLLVLVGQSFRGAFDPKVRLTLLTARAGLVLDPGAKVTYNGVPVGRVAEVGTAARTGTGVRARVMLDVDPRYVPLLPANVEASVTATTVFGNKYVALRSPEHPSAQRVSPATPIDATGVTTEFNTLFETIMRITEQVDPIALNQTLSAAAQALAGLGDRFGASLLDGNAILDDLNARIPPLRRDVAGLADLAAIYADSAPDLFTGLDDAARGAATLNSQRGEVDAALIAAVGFAGTTSDILERGGPYLLRGAADLLPTSRLLDDYRAMIFCTIRNYHDVAPELDRALGGDNGYSLSAAGTPSSIGAGNVYVYPDNLPRVNAKGGPEGRPGCWQKITRELWPAPYLVMDTGLSVAPYNHVELGSPIFVDYVWGRQIGEPTINP